MSLAGRTVRMTRVGIRRGLRQLRSLIGARALRPNAFSLAFVAAFLGAAIISARVLTGGDIPAHANTAILLASAVNLALLLALAGALAYRLRRLAKGGSADEPAPRLHLRFVAILGLGAVVPALVSAAIIGIVFARVIDQWFSPRIESVVEGVAGIARTYLSVEGRTVAEQLRAMARDLNQSEAAEALATNRITYVGYLREQASRRGFEAAYVIDGDGAILARAELDGAASFETPSRASYADAQDGEMALSVDRDDGRIRVLFRLAAYDDAFVYVVRELGDGLMPQLTSAEEAVVSYRAADDEQNRLRLLLVLIYTQWAMLVALGAAWFGLNAANRFVAPIGRLVRAAERVRDGDLEARVFFDERRDEIAMLGRAFNEMTGQLKSQRADLIEASEVAERRRQFTEAVLAGVSAGVIGVDSSGLVTIVNRSALALLDQESDRELIGREALVVLPEFAGLVQQARASRRVVAAEIEIERGGRSLNLNVRAGAAKDGSGAVVVTFDDITRLVSAQRSAAWRDVARRIAHEIKNPLTPIQLSAERLRRKYKSEIQSDIEVFDRCTDTIVRQVSDIRRMIDEFSSFARMPEPKVEPVDLTEVVRSTVFAQRVASPDIEFEAHVPDEPVIVNCDERLIAQALANIVKNAAEAVMGLIESEDPGGKGGDWRVETTLSVRDGAAVIEVADNGLGWPMTDRDRLVEPYMTTREKGTGLGLAIVRRVMEDHHGRLELGDRHDGERGALVRLVLPAEPARPEASSAGATAGGGLA